MIEKKTDKNLVSVILPSRMIVRRSRRPRVEGPLRVNGRERFNNELEVVVVVHVGNFSTLTR